MNFLKKKIKSLTLHPYMVIFLTAALVGIFVTTLSTDAGKALIAVSIISIGLIYFLRSEKKAILQIIIFAFLIRAFFGIASSEFNIIPDFFGDPDLYHQRAVLLVESIKQGNFITTIDQTFSSLESLSFSYFNVPFYILTGNSFLSMKVINSLFGVLTAYFFYKIILTIFNYKSAKTGLFLIAFFPSFILFSSQNFADSAIALFTGLFLYLSIQFIKQQKLKYLFYALIPAAIASLFRSPNSVIYVLSIAPFIILYLYKLKNTTLKPILMSVIFLIALAFSFFVYSNISNLTKISTLEHERQVHTRGESLYLENISYTSQLDIIKYAPIRTFYFTFSPMPWQINRLIAYFAALESLLMLSFLIISVKHFFPIKKLINQNQALIFIVTFLILGTVSYGIVESNIGAAIRHRIIFTPVIIVLASYFLAKLNFNFFKNNETA